jgi:hypothetical protein
MKRAGKYNIAFVLVIKSLHQTQGMGRRGDLVSEPLMDEDEAAAPPPPPAC